MDTSGTLTTLGTHDTWLRHIKQRRKKLKRWATWTLSKNTGVIPGARKW